MTQVLARLRRMTREELTWRTRATMRIAADRMSARLRRPSWNRGDIARVLSKGVFGTSLREAVKGRQWQQVHDCLDQHICTRGSRFALDPASALATRAEVLRRWPGAAADAARRAESILEGRYDLLGYRALTFSTTGGLVDWHLDPVHRASPPLRFWADVPYLDPAIGDHKIIWELNRQQHWLKLGRALWTTGDDRYGRRMIDELQSWLAANPPLLGINWSSMLELAFRSMSWLWGLHFLLGAVDRSSVSDPDFGPPTSNPRSPWLVDMFVALDWQLTHIERNLSTYFSPNTHLTGEALALYVAGVALPELAGSMRWRNAGRQILLQEIDRQIGSDGGHVERSTHYHRYTLDFYLMALITARRDGDAIAERHFADATARLAEFALAMADSTGCLPVIGDDDGGMLWPFTGRQCQDVRDSLAVAGALLDKPELALWGPQEEACWIAGSTRDRNTGAPAPDNGRRHAPPSRLLADTGYVVARDAHGNHAIFDVGAHGFMNGGHAHADALSLTLSLDGRPFLIDPGTATYTMDARLRDRFRNSASHNTITVDRRSQAQSSGPFHWRTRADATLHEWRTYPRLDWAQGSHDAYTPIRHRRSVLRTADSGWLVVDEILGAGVHVAEAYWHIHPDWQLCNEAPGCLRAIHSDGSESWILYDTGDLRLVRGDGQSGLGWHAPVYGAVQPAWTARVTNTQAAPFAMITWFGAGGAAQERPSLERLLAGGKSDDQPIGARLRIGNRASVFLMQPGDRNSSQGYVTPEAAGYRTDARLLHCVEEHGTATRLDLIDVTHAQTPDDGLRLNGSERMPYLHVSFEGPVLALEASQPPSQLLIDGRLVQEVSAIRLNQRGLVPYRSGSGGAVCVLAADWARPVRELLPTMA